VVKPRIVDVAGNTRAVDVVGVNRGRTIVRFHEKKGPVREMLFVVTARAGGP